MLVEVILGFVMLLVRSMFAIRRSVDLLIRVVDLSLNVSLDNIPFLVRNRKSCIGICVVLNLQSAKDTAHPAVCHHPFIPPLLPKFNQYSKFGEDIEMVVRLAVEIVSMIPVIPVSVPERGVVGRRSGVTRARTHPENQTKPF